VSASEQRANEFWQYYRIGRENMAYSLGISLEAVTDLRERRACATHELARRIEEIYEVPIKELANYRTSQHWFFVTKPHEPAAPPRAIAKPRAERERTMTDIFTSKGKDAETEQRRYVENLARQTGISFAAIWSFLYRRRIPKKHMAQLLELATEIDAAVWLSARTSAHPIFQGPRAQYRRRRPRLAK
jgi:hypothetical protein